jgi:hypothetical protein
MAHRLGHKIHHFKPCRRQDKNHRQWEIKKQWGKYFQKCDCRGNNVLCGSNHMKDYNICRTVFFFSLLSLFISLSYTSKNKLKRWLQMYARDGWWGTLSYQPFWRLTTYTHNWHPRTRSHIGISPPKKGLEKGLRRCWADAKSTRHICPNYEFFSFVHRINVKPPVFRKGV